MPTHPTKCFFASLPTVPDNVLASFRVWCTKKQITINQLTVINNAVQLLITSNAPLRYDNLKRSFQIAYGHPFNDFVFKIRDPDVEPVQAVPAAVAAPAAVNIVSLANGFDVEGVMVRKTLTPGSPPKVSVYDLIEAVTGQPTTSARIIFVRIVAANPEVNTMCINFKFPGRGQRPTPVTDARGVVTILNLLPGRAAARFRAASADVMVRFLGGDLTLVAEIRRNAEAQQQLPADNPARMFGEDVEARAAREEVPPPFLLRSVTNVIDLRSSQLYFRQIMGEFTNVHPRGRPDLALSADEIARAVFVKLGSMGQTDRQMQHQTAFKGSELVDSLLTVAQTSVEQKFKDLLMDRGMLFEGMHQSKTTKDTELLIIPTQDAYEELVHMARTIVNDVHTSVGGGELPLEALLSMEETKRVLAIEETKRVLAIEKTKQVLAEFEILKFRVSHSLI